MKKKQMKVNPKKHAKKAKLVKGAKVIGSIVVTAGSIGLAISKNVVKNKIQVCKHRLI